MVQPQSHGVAEISGPGRVRPQPEGQRRARRPDSEYAQCKQQMFSSRQRLKVVSSLVDAGASVQLGHTGHAPEHPSSEDAAETPPDHQLQQPGGSTSTAGEEGVHGGGGLHPTQHHS